MPAKVFLTYSQKDRSSEQYLEVNQFNRYFTFQVEIPPKPANQEFETSPEDGKIQYQRRHMETRFTLPEGEGKKYLLRLRAELSTASSDSLQQGMRVTLLEGNTTYKPLEDHASFKYGEGIVNFDSIDLRPGAEYILRYDFYDKERPNVGGADSQHSHGGIQCTQPFITEQLYIVDLDLTQDRIAEWSKEDKQAKEIKDLHAEKGLACEFNNFNNTLESEFGEEGVFCPAEQYTYDLEKSKKISAAGFYRLHETPFEVRGIQSQAVTYWFQMTVHFNILASGGGIKVLLARQTHEFSHHNPFICLNDKQCVEASLSAASTLKLDVILTTGLYKLVILAEEAEKIGKALYIRERPISIEVQAYPIIQNEERVNCPYMYLESDFLQQKYFGGSSGRKSFVFSDKIIMNLFNLTNSFEISPQYDVMLKMRIKEAYGVNTEMVLCQQDDCLVSSTQLGTSEILVAQLSKGQTYEMKLSYSHSLIEVSDFFQCPHHSLEVVVIPVTEYLSMTAGNSGTHLEMTESDQLLSEVFKNITDSDSMMGYVYLNDLQRFKYTTTSTSAPADSQEATNSIVTAKRFVVAQKMQFLAEVYFDPYQLYDLELSLFSVKFEQLSNKHLDMTLYKGDKRLFVELDPGAYELKISRKVGAWQDFETEVPSAAKLAVEFQLSIIYAEYISRQHVMPHSLNYMGLMNPKKQDMIYLCHDCIFDENEHYKTMEFITPALGSGASDLYFTGVLVSHTGLLDLILEQIPNHPTQDLTVQDYLTAFETLKERGTLVAQGENPMQARGGEQQTRIGMQLQSNKRYRLVVLLKSALTGQSDVEGFEETRFTLRIQTQCKGASMKSRDESLPQSLEEIQRRKVKPEGKQESEFMMGSRQVLKWIAKYNMEPWFRKSKKVYHTKAKGVVQSLKFEVKEEQSMIWAAVYDYSPIASNIQLMITKNDMQKFSIDQVEWGVASIPGENYNYLEPLTLTKGTYYLSILTNPSFQQSVTSFSMDFLVYSESSDPFSTFLQSTLTLCPSSHSSSLPRVLSDSPAHLHALTGHSFSTTLRPRLSDLLLGQSMIVESVHSESLLIFYVEVPKGELVEVRLAREGNSREAIATTKGIEEKTPENFMKAAGYGHRGVIQMREQILSGQKYYLYVRGAGERSLFDRNVGRCSLAKVAISIIPQNKEAGNPVLGFDKCESPIHLGSKLDFTQHFTGQLSYGLNSAVLDTTYIKTDEQGGEGPFFFYFQVQQDPASLEGQLSLILYRYDQSTLAFTEVAAAQALSGLLQLSVKLSQGTYVLKLESLTSTATKYSTQTLSLTALKEHRLQVSDPCLRLNYSYYLVSTNSIEAASMIFTSFFEMLASMISGKVEDRLSQRKEDEVLIREIGDDAANMISDGCQEMPELVEGEGEWAWHIKVDEDALSQTVELIVPEEVSVVKLMLQTRNPRDNINAFLYDSLNHTQLLAWSEPDFDYKTLWVQIKPSKKPYKLKFIYDTLDESETTPSFYFRLSITSLENLMTNSDMMQCADEFKSPPKFLELKQLSQEAEIFSLDTTWSMPMSELYESRHQDIELKLPSALEPNTTLYFDLETTFDFAVTDIELSIYRRSSDGPLKLVGSSENIDWESETTRLLSSTRLKAQREFEKADKYLVRMTFPAKLPFRPKEDSCFRYDISMRVTASQQLNEARYLEPDGRVLENQLARVAWQGTVQKSDNTSFYDSREKVLAILEFKQSMRDQHSTIKFSQFASLVSKSHPSFLIYPTVVKLSQQDKSNVILHFGKSVLKPGECYKLKINGDLFGIKNLVEPQEFCTSKCLCNPHGTSSCNQQTGACKCHPPFQGKTCTECDQAHLFDQKTQLCLPITKCKQDGGAIDCNGHGQCYHEYDKDGGEPVAKCQCDPGFANDGLDLCSRCEDSMFQYPDCFSIRQFLVESSSHDCARLPTKMPTYLYKESTANQPKNQSTYYQNPETLEGIWYSVYRVNAETHHMRQSEHKFKVKGPMVLRLFIDTHNSGLKLKYFITDPEKNLIHQESKSVDRGHGYLTHLEADGDHTLTLQYEITDPAHDCPRVEIFFVLQHSQEVLNLLRCESEDFEEPSTKPMTFSGQSEFTTIPLTFSTQHSPASLSGYQYTFPVTIGEPHNALSIVASFQFEVAWVNLVLKDSKGQLLASQRHESLEDVIQTEGRQVIDQEANMMTILEIPKIDRGQYTLDVSVNKLVFLGAKQESCVQASLMVEYVNRKSGTDQRFKYEVLGVYPLKLEGLTNVPDSHMAKARIEVRFDHDLELSEVAKNIAQENKICLLENSQGETIEPDRHLRSGITGALDFYFDFQRVKLPSSGKSCYKLKCSTKGILEHEEIRDTVGSATQYCFEDLSSSLRCNPNCGALLRNGECKCKYPFKGKECQECDTHYLRSKDSFGDTLCKLDTSKCSDELCNGHGSCAERTGSPQCICDTRYAGKRCEKCADKNFKYPLCDGDDIDFAEEQSSLESARFTADQLEDIVDKLQKGKRLKHQCSFTNFPEDLDRLEFMNFVSGGDFHVANFYTINHNTPNVITFTPRKEGTIKILVQTPEDVSDLTKAQDSLDYEIEIALYDPLEEEVVEKALNARIEFTNKELKGEMDYTQMSFEVKRQHLNRTLMILFQAENFVEEDDEKEDCLEVFIELQYSSTPAIKRNDLQSTNLDQLFSFPLTSISTAFTLQDPTTPLKTLTSSRGTSGGYFYHTDFYFGNLDFSSDLSSDFSFTVSLYQPFIQDGASPMIDFLLEILGTDVDKPEPSQLGEEARYLGPQCKKTCIAGGQKGYNEVSNTIEVSSGTYLRLWLMQIGDGGQAEYQLQVTGKKVEEVTQGVHQCREEDVPASLNTDRYLGMEGQKAFHYIERYRVDNLAKNHHEISFSLEEETYVRIVALIHKHRLEFDLDLYQRDVKLVQAQQKSSEDVIFVRLSPGKYSLRILFSATEAHLRRQPCQSIEIELAMQSAKEVEQIMSKATSTQENPMTLEKVVSGENIQFALGNAIRTYNFKDLSEFTPYHELLRTRFTPLLSHHKQGLIISSQISNFLLSDVSFLLKNLNTKHLSRSERFEGLNRLVLDHLTSGHEYELIVYSYHCLTNAAEGDRRIPISVQLDMSLVAWKDERAITMPQQHGWIASDEQTMRVKVEAIGDRGCMRELPERATGGEVFGEFAIPKAEGYEHNMEYRVATKGQDRLRVLITGRPETKIVLYKKSTSHHYQDPLFSSVSLNNNQDSVLFAQDLEPSETYLIVFTFSANADDTSLSRSQFSESCEIVGLHMQAFKDEACVKSATSDIREVKATQVVSRHQLMIQNSIEAIPLIISENLTEITLSLDFSSMYYLPSIKLRRDKTDEKPLSLDQDSKNKVVYRFKVSKADGSKYQIVITHPQKLKGCINRVVIEIVGQEGTSVSEYLERPFFGILKTYTSHQEIAQNGWSGSELPISLDSLKYLHGLSDSYLEVSEVISLSPTNFDANKITFTLNPERWNRTLIRVLIETQDVIFSLSKQGSSSISWKTTSLSQIIDPGAYEVKFDFVTEMIKHKAQAQGKDSFKVTIVITDEAFYRERYLKSQVKAFRDCKLSKNLPLVLNKVNSLLVFEDELAYDDPLMRLSGTSLATDYILDTFHFRLNQTSRFHFTIGSHLIQSVPTLKVSEMRDMGNSYVGQQDFRLNTLDIILGPGDYSLSLEQPQLIDLDFTQRAHVMEWLSLNTTAENVCALYSFSGRVTPIEEVDSEMAIGHRGMIDSTQFKCEVVEMLPSKIYKQESETKGGSEFFINSEGTFSYIFGSILMKKSPQSVTEPEFDRINLSPPEDGLLSLLIQYPSQRNHLKVQLYDAFSFSLCADQAHGQPKVQHQSLEGSSHGLIEETYSFEVLKHRQYLLMIYYQGELNHDSKGKELCEYYSLMLSYNSQQRLLSELLCLPPAAITKKMTQWHEFMANTFKETNTNYSGYLEIKYPRDYSESKDGLMVRSTEVQISKGGQQLFDLDFKVRFDNPFILPELGFFQRLKSDNEVTLEDLAVQFPVQPEMNDPFQVTLSRELKMSGFKSENKDYLITLSDEVSSPLLSYLLSKSPDVKELCIYSSYQLTLTKQSAPSEQTRGPAFITAVHPISGPISPSTKQLSISFTLSKPLDATNTLSKDDFKLQVFEGQTLLYSKTPVNVQLSRNVIIVTFNGLQDAQHTHQLRVLVDGLDSKFIQLAKGVQLPIYTIQRETGEEKRRKEEAAKGSQAEKIRQEVNPQKDIVKAAKKPPQPPASTEVKCLCKHGKCMKGESQCSRCDKGWTGMPLCDVKVDETPSKISRRGKGTQDEVENMSNPYSQQMKPQVLSEDRMEEPDKEDSSSILSQLLKLSVLIGISAFAYKHYDKLKDYFAPPKKPIQEEEAMELINLKKYDSNPQLQLYDEDEATEQENHGSTESISRLQPQNFSTTQGDDEDADEREHYELAKFF